MIQNILNNQKKLLIFFILMACLFFVSAGNVECKQSQKIFSTIATGTQVITSEFSPKIKKQAVKRALKTCVERAVSEVLSTEVFASNLEALDGQVLVNPSKYIVNYSVIAELRADSKYVAAVKVRVNLTLLKKYLKRYGIIKNNREKPSVLLLISEKSEQDTLLKYWWGKNPLPYESLVANEIVQFMSDKEFVMISDNRAKAGIKKNEIVFISIYDTSAAIKLGKKLKADIVIIGKAKSFEALNKMGEEKIYEADLSLIMFNVNTQKRIKDFELKATAKSYENEEGNNSVLKKAGKLAAKEITIVANKYWEENILKKEQRIETRIEGEDYLSSFILLRKAINEIEGIKSVQTRELGADQASVSILFKGNAEQLAQALLLKTFDSFGIEIYNVKDKSFTIKFVSK
jgi:hypothetical protein